MDNTNIINEIRSKVDIVDIISSYLPLTQKGKNFFGQACYFLCFPSLLPTHKATWATCLQKPF